MEIYIVSFYLQTFCSDLFIYLCLVDHLLFRGMCMKGFYIYEQRLIL